MLNKMVGLIIIFFALPLSLGLTTLLFLEKFKTGFMIGLGLEIFFIALILIAALGVYIGK